MSVDFRGQERDGPCESSPLLPPSNDRKDIYDDETIDPKAYWLLPALAIGVFLGAADQTIVISSYGRIGTELDALNKTSWLATAYLLPLSSLQLLYGTLSHIFGLKPLFLFAYLAFTLGCLLCGLSQTMNQLIIARAITGVAGGFNTIASIVLADIVPLRKRGIWQGWRNLVFAVGLGAGSCGGWVTDRIGWRWSFLLQVPVCLLGLLNICFAYEFSADYSKESLTARLRRVDFAGAILIVSAVAALLIGFDQGSNDSWASFATISCLIASALLFVSFFYVELHVAVEPFAPKSVLVDPTLAACLASSFCAYGCWFGILYYLPLFWQAVEGLDASQASVRLLPGVATGVFGSLLAGMVGVPVLHPCPDIALTAGQKIIERTGRYCHLSIVSYAALTLGAIFLVLFTGGVISSLIGLLIGYIVCGFALNVGSTSTLVALMASASPVDQAPALSCLHLFRSLGSEFGLALSAATIQFTLQTAVPKAISGSMSAREVAVVVERIRKSLEFLDTLEPDLKEVVRECYGVAVRWVLGLAAVFAGGSFVACIGIKEKRISSR
ncbi:MAG: hypothetical protein Q9163_004983 [Psora crenata]